MLFDATSHNKTNEGVSKRKESLENLPAPTHINVSSESNKNLPCKQPTQLQGTQNILHLNWMLMERTFIKLTAPPSSLTRAGGPQQWL